MPACEAQRLSVHHEELMKTAARLETQRHRLQYLACGAAAVVALGAAYLEFVVLCYIMSANREVSDFFILLATVPIISIVLVMIFVLVGVFRGYHETGHLSPSAIQAGRTAIGSAF